MQTSKTLFILLFKAFQFIFFLFLNIDLLSLSALECFPRNVEEIALDLRGSLDESLTTTRKLSRSDDSLSTLINRMNVVLGAAVVTNFGSDTNNQLGILLETIDRLQLAMIKGCENLSLLYFSRSFAVVVEEAARQKEEKSFAFRGKPREVAKHRDSYSSCSDQSAVLQHMQQNSFPWCSCPGHSTSVPCVFPRTSSYLDFDHSPEATLGALSELHLYHGHDVRNHSLVICRYESFEVARVARTLLHGKTYFGSRLFVYFAKFRIKLPRTKRLADGDAPGAYADADTAYDSNDTS